LLVQALFRSRFQKLVLSAMKAAAILMVLATASANELTKETWDAAVAGKSVFVKFLAPW